MLKTALIIVLGIIFLALLPAFAQDAPSPTATVSPDEWASWMQFNCYIHP